MVRRCILLSASVITLVICSAIPTLGQAPNKPVQVALVPSGFRGVPDALIPVVVQPFRILIKEQTGIDSELTVTKGPYDAAKRLDEGEFELAVLFGHEFAWVREKHPKVHPLMIISSGRDFMQAKLVVRDDSRAKDIDDLKGEKLALAERAREHNELFLKRQTYPAKLDDFFDLLTKPSNEEALDAVITGDAAAAVVDIADLDHYRQLKPGGFARLQVVQESEIFPPGIIVYRENSLDEATLQRFREGLLQADSTVRGRELLATVQIRNFAPVPENLQAAVDNILRHYPPPARD